MSKRRAAERGKQASNDPQALPMVMRQMVLPLIVGAEATKRGLLAFVQQMGMLALRELFDGEAEMVAGPKGKHVTARTHHHWGTTRTPLPFGGRHVVVERPRVRRKSGGEEMLPSVAAFREADPLTARVAEQIVLGVSTRGYAHSLEPLAEEMEARGASKSAASRALIDKTAEKLAAFLDRRLDDVELIAMLLDGIEVAEETVIIALGVTTDGTKVPLGLWTGSTENHVVAGALLQNLIERGLRVEQPMLFVIDGGKGIHKALRQVFGDRAVIQRCQVHKLRNVASPSRFGIGLSSRRKGVVRRSRSLCSRHTCRFHRRRRSDLTPIPKMSDDAAGRPTTAVLRKAGRSACRRPRSPCGGALRPAAAVRRSAA
jgi:putative transposase